MQVSTQKVISVVLSEEEARKLSSLIFHARQQRTNGYEIWMEDLESKIDEVVNNK